MRTTPLLVLTGAAIALSVADLHNYAAGQRRSSALLEEFDLAVRYPALRAEVERRYDPVDAELRVAQALLNDELDRSWMVELEPEALERELERGPERLARAEAVARGSWPRRPASWLAPMVLGGARYLSLARGTDQRLMGDSELWERPLAAARRLGPAEPGPLRFLAAAYLGNWSSLAPEQRDQTRELLRSAFLDRQSFRLLIRDWLRIAPSRRQALELVPNEPWAWRALQQVFSTAGDWELFATARRRWYDALQTEAGEVLRDAESQLTLGEVVDTRSRLLRMAQLLPRSLDFAPHFQRLIEILPPGPVNAPSARAFAEWLEWSVELSEFDESPFPEPALARLARLAGDLEPGRRAAALLSAGDGPGAALLERRFGDSAAPGWSSYHLLKARRLASEGKGTDARSSLFEVSPAERSGAVYWTTAAAVAALAEDDQLAERAERELASLRSDRWEAAGWHSESDRWTRTLLPTGDFVALEVEVLGSSAPGAVVEVSWDDRLLDVRRTSRAAEVLRFELPITAVPHRLAVRIHARQQVRAGAVRVL